MKNIVVNSEQEEKAEPKDKRERVMELRRALQEPELEESLSLVAATMHVLTGKDRDGSSVGPTPTVEVLFEGVPTHALLDTGSPVTIVSLNFVLQALVKQRNESQTPTEWEQEVKARLSPPKLTLQNYGGGDLDIIRQRTANISRENYATVLMQKDDPLDLLLGTDLHASLGFLLLETGSNGRALDLLQNKEWEVSELSTAEQLKDSRKETTPESAISEETPQPAVVRLITAVWLPARHGKLVRTNASNFPEDSVALFEPTGDQLKKRGLTIEEAAMQPDNQQHITLIVRNNSLESVSLQEGEVLGYLQLVVLVPTSETVEQVYRTTLDGLVRSLHPTDLTVGDCSQDDNTYSERDRQLLDTIDWDALEVTEDEHQQLKGVLLKYADVFALAPTELGSTDFVYHTIDTSVQLRLAQFFWANLYKCCESGARPTRASAFI